MLIIRLCHKDFILDISLCIYFKSSGQGKSKRVNSMVEKRSVHEGRKRGAKQWFKIYEKGEPLKLDMQLESHNLSYKRQCIDVRVGAKNREAPSSS